MDIDRQAIERRDFPIGRRGYDPTAVDAHLRALAAEFEELQRTSAGAGEEPSLASIASTQVQSILTAAETAAADIERQALADAKDAREQAGRDAQRTREDAIEKARAHVAAVAAATALLLERVSTMDAEVEALLDSVRAGAGRLAGDLATVQTNMGELYDAASGHAAGDPAPSPSAAPPPPAVASSAFGPPLSPTAPPAPPPPEAAPAVAPAPVAAPSAAQPVAPEPAPAEAQAKQDLPAAPARANGDPNGDLDSARLIALNMALNGESRADADRYLAENFKLTDREKLIAEVYAAIEG